MSTAEILQELPKLKPEERRVVRARLNELDGVADDPWIDGGELTEEEKAMLDARLAEYEKNPEAGSSWEEVEARLRMQLRQVYQACVGQSAGVPLDAPPAACSPNSHASFSLPNLLPVARRRSGCVRCDSWKAAGGELG